MNARVAAAALLLSCQPAAPAPPPPFAGRASLDLETSEGTVRCALDGARAPRAVGMIVGLAGGRAPFRDERTGVVVTRPYYDGMVFFRALPGAYVQTGSRAGDGSGSPGYRLPVETSAADGARLARPGALFLARYTPPPGRADPRPPPAGLVVGGQLVIAQGDMSHLAGRVTVVGACGDLDVVARIADDVASGRPARIVRATAATQ
jgi:cyclophilin family peptidyl-prolyl cis-trans isomerase